MIYEDNAACIAHIKAGYIKGDQIKHISPKFFSTHELLEWDIDVKQIRSFDNLLNYLPSHYQPLGIEKLLRE